MNMESFIILFFGIVSPLTTIFISLWQRWNESKRVPSQNAVDLSSAMEHYGESWNTLISQYKEELERVNSRKKADDEKLLKQIDTLEIKLNEAKDIISDMEKRNKKKYEILYSRITELEHGVDSLVAQIIECGETPVFSLEDKKD